MLIADRAQFLQEAGGRLIKTTLALHRFNDDRGHPARIDVCFEQLIKCCKRVLLRDAVQADREGCMEYIARHCAKSGLIGKHFAR